MTITQSHLFKAIIII